MKHHALELDLSASKPACCTLKCSAIQHISPEFHSMIQENCKGCQDTAAPCLIDLMFAHVTPD
jgi:hypothetical protein